MKIYSCNSSDVYVYTQSIVYVFAVYTMADNGSGSLVFGASLRGEIAHVAGSGTTLPGEFGSASDAHSDAAESDSESGSVAP